MFKARRLLFSGLALLSGLAGAQGDSSEAVRQEFRQAYASALTGVETGDSQALRRYILYPYLQAARLIKVLERDPLDADPQVEAFLQANGTAPAGRELRRVWLLSLAQRAQWMQFLKHYAADSADLELRCRALSARLASQQVKELQSELPPIWMTATRLPPNCSVPMAWGRAQNVITPEMIEQRAVLALKGGNAAVARELLPSVPAPRAEPLSQWLQLIEQPQAAIDRLLADPAIVVDHSALLDGWTRLARKDQDAALARYQRLVASRAPNTAVASPYALSLALALAWSRRPEALDYFERVNSVDFTDLAWEWYARAALWAGDWQRVAKVITGMPSTLRTQARWRYWSARAAEQLHDRAAARAGYAQLVDTEDNYYAALAAAHLKKRYLPHIEALSVEKGLPEALETRPGVQRARELFFTALKSQAGVEWNVEYKGMSAADQSAAIKLASRWGWHDVAIATAAQQRIFNDYALLYPRPYDDEVKAAAKRVKLSAELVYAQLRQESLYKPDAISTANARGLLQLVPETARATAKRWKLPVPKPDDLLDPAVNLPLGTAHLRELIDTYDGQLVVALAAYNAGPNAAARWLPSRPMDADAWIENIPYNETRNYVQKILWHNIVFEWLKHDHSVDTRDLIGKVRS